MAKEKVFIILSHKNSLKKGTKKDWEVTELVEFVNQVRPKHLSTASAIGNYLDRTMVIGSRHGMTDYNKYEQYIRTKYPKQMQELDVAYNDQRLVVKNETPVMVDEFGNMRPKTVFDVA